MFIAAQFTIAKTWRQPKCPSTDDKIKKILHIYIYTHIYTHNRILIIKNNEIMPFAATWVDLLIIILSEVSLRNANIIWYHLYVDSKIKRYK